MHEKHSMCVSAPLLCVSSWTCGAACVCIEDRSVSRGKPAGLNMSNIRWNLNRGVSEPVKLLREGNKPPSPVRHHRLMEALLNTDFSDTSFIKTSTAHGSIISFRLLNVSDEKIITSCHLYNHTVIFHALTNVNRLMSLLKRTTVNNAVRRPFTVCIISLGVTIILYTEFLKKSSRQD